MYYFEYCCIFDSSQSTLHAIKELLGCLKGLIPFSSFWLIVLFCRCFYNSLRLREKNTKIYSRRLYYFVMRWILVSSENK
jgi:tRNA (Thr-GGU) A37 N-methylase